MNPSEDRNAGVLLADHSHAHAAPHDDPRLIQALEDYVALLEAGGSPDRRQFQARYPDIADALAECLDGADFVHAAAPYLTPAEIAQAGAWELPARSTLGDFTIVRELGRGGMGVVYEAEQASLGRRVALKVLPVAATWDVRHLQRFKNEAQAAAQLRHEHIVPIFSVGCDQGVHYYAMQYIDGLNLADWIAERKRLGGTRIAEGARELAADYLPAPRRDNRPVLPLTKSGLGGEPASEPLAATTGTVPPLGKGGLSGVRSGVVRPGPAPKASSSRDYLRTVAALGIQAAEALEYAHQCGVIHRDIKPANLLLDRRGHLWISDFGLARFPGNPGLTVTGDLIGTLRYMSPEQALARPEAVDQRSDIYSLGATLYELATWQPLFNGMDRNEILRQITFDEPRPPRSVNPALPWEMETILLKALAKAPAERYASAGELAGDLRRFLADQPLRARRPTLGQRARKWGRRHRQALAAGVSLMAVLLVLLSVSIFLIARKADETDRRRRQARRAVDDMYTQLAEKWLSQAHQGEGLERDFLLKARDFYQELAEDGASTSEERLEAARANRRVGDIDHHLGNEREAEEAYAKAIAQLTTLLKTLTGGAEVWAAPAWEELGLCYNNRGHVYRQAERLPDAERNYRAAHDVFSRLVTDHPDVVTYQADLAGNCTNLGIAALAAQRVNAAEEYDRQALELWTKLAASDSGNSPHNLAGCRQNMANVLAAQGRFSEARVFYQQAMAAWKKLTAAFPTWPAYRQALGVCHAGLGTLLAATNRLTEAEAAHRQALAARQALADAFPLVPIYRQETAESWHCLGNLCLAAKRFAEAEEKHRQALKSREKLAADFPDRADYRRDVASSRQALAEVFRRAGKLEEALAACRLALELRQKLALEFPASAEDRADLPENYRQLAAILADGGRLAEADENYRRALPLWTALGQDFPQMPYYRLGLTDCWREYGNLLEKTGKTAEAAEALRNAEKVEENVRDEFPDMVATAGQGGRA